MINKGIPEIFSVIKLDTGFETDESLKFLNSIFAENISRTLNNLKEYTEEELQKIINFIFKKIKNFEHMPIYLLGETVFFFYHAKNKVLSQSLV